MHRLKLANIKLETDNCEFSPYEVSHLGHIIDQDDIRSNPKKIMTVRRFPIPKKKKHIKQYLGISGFCRKCIGRFSHIAHLLTHLLKKDVPFDWSKEQDAAFNTLKNVLCEEPL